MEEAICYCGGCYRLNINTVVALAQAKNKGFAGLASWDWSQAN